MKDAKPDCNYADVEKTLEDVLEMFGAILERTEGGTDQG
jgi:hypothetical protein